jgi:hypothetical protein
MKLQLMDYSLLLGVHDCEQAEQENKEILERSERKFLRILGLYFSAVTHCLLNNASYTSKLL